MSDGMVWNTMEACRSFYPSMESDGVRQKGLEGEGNLVTSGSHLVTIVTMGESKRTRASKSPNDNNPCYHWICQQSSSPLNPIRLISPRSSKTRPRPTRKTKPTIPTVIITSHPLEMTSQTAGTSTTTTTGTLIPPPTNLLMEQQP